MPTFNDLKLLTRDYTGNYSTGVAQKETEIRAINRSIEYCRNSLGLPSDQKNTTIHQIPGNKF